MPRPIPPPPPQPSAEETRAGVRLVGVVAAGFVAAFLGLSQQYHLRGWAVEYGRDNGASWNLYKLDRLDVEALRGEADHRIAWLVGSSILRDSFDEQAINDSLAAMDSPWRVAKFGQTRGAAGMSWGMVRRLPLEPGDMVVHNVAMENFRADWLDFTGLPGWRVQLMLEPAELLRIKEWPWQTRLEELVAVPRDFYRFHEEHMAGLQRWLALPFTGRWPRPRRHSMHTRYREVEELENLHTARARGEDSPYFLGDEDIDLSPTQFNMLGIRRIRAACAAAGVALHLVDIPPRQEYTATFMTDTVREQWDQWRAQQPELSYFPQQPERAYYDMKHPNAEGREALSRYLMDWLHEPTRGAPAPLEWPP